MEWSFWFFYSGYQGSHAISERNDDGLTPEDKIKEGVTEKYEQFKEELKEKVQDLKDLAKETAKKTKNKMKELTADMFSRFERWLDWKYVSFYLVVFE